MAIDVTLRDIQSGFLTATAFTENNTLIEEALQKALNREGGANNEMLADLDLGLNNIINVENLDVNSITVDGTNYETYLTNIANGFLGDVQLIADAAQQSADDSANSAASSLTSEQNAATSEFNTQALLQDFRSRYYGTDTSDPALDPNGNPPTEGDLYYNTVTNMLRVLANGIWVNAPESPVFDVFGRIGNIVAEAGDYTAEQITYNNTSSGLTAVEIQAAVDELEGRLESAESSLSGHLSSTTAHASEDIAYDNTTSGSTATNVKGAVDDIYSQIGDISTALDEINGEVV